MILSSVINAHISRAVMLQDVHVHYIFLRFFFLLGRGRVVVFVLYSLFYDQLYTVP